MFTLFLCLGSLWQMGYGRFSFESTKRKQNNVSQQTYQKYIKNQWHFKHNLKVPLWGSRRDNAFGVTALNLDNTSSKLGYRRLGGKNLNWLSLEQIWLMRFSSLKFFVVTAAMARPLKPLYSKITEIWTNTDQKWGRAFRNFFLLILEL